MAEFSLVRLSTAVCGAKPIVPWFSAGCATSLTGCQIRLNRVPDIVSEACSRSYYSCSEVGVYKESWPRCCAGVCAPRLTVNGKVLGAVTRRAHGTVALPPCQDSKALPGLSCGRQKA